jgi:hypothetical protein
MWRMARSDSFAPETGEIEVAPVAVSVRRNETAPA